MALIVLVLCFLLVHFVLKLNVVIMCTESIHYKDFTKGKCLCQSFPKCLTILLACHCHFWDLLNTISILPCGSNYHEEGIALVRLVLSNWLKEVLHPCQDIHCDAIYASPIPLDGWIYIVKPLEPWHFIVQTIVNLFESSLIDKFSPNNVIPILPPMLDFISHYKNINHWQGVS